MTTSSKPTSSQRSPRPFGRSAWRSHLWRLSQHTRDEHLDREDSLSEHLATARPALWQRRQRANALSPLVRHHSIEPRGSSTPTDED